MEPEAYAWQFSPRTFWILLLISLLMISLQSAFEEVMFRGWLLQGLGLLFGNRWVPLLITSLVFGIMHMMNPEVNAFGTGIMFINYASFGLFLGMIAVMDEGLEIPIAIHAANNIYASTIVTFPDSALQTQALFSANNMDGGWSSLSWIIPAAILICVLRKKYSWQFKSLMKSNARMQLPDKAWDSAKQ